MSANAELFDAAPATKDEPVDLYSLHARKILGIDGWRWYSIEAIEPSTIMLKGAVCTAVYASGKRKGRTNWEKRDRATERTIAFSEAEHRAFVESWAQESGKCARCTGTGRLFQSWKAGEGAKYRECGTCAGSGRAALAESEKGDGK